MISIVDSVKNFISKPATTSTNVNDLRVLKAKKDILKAITDAKDNQKVLGVYAPALGEGLFLTGVLIVDTDQQEPIITFSRYDLNRVYLTRTELSISEIKGVCVFNQKFQNPLLTRQEFETTV